MIYSFDLKQVEAPLFGVVEVDDTKTWLAAFSSPYIPTSVVLDEDAFNMIAEDLGMNVEGLAYSAELYVQGKHRPGTAGLGGSALGDIGEVLTFVVQRASGKSIVRVISGTRDAPEAVIDNRFPQPDFIVCELGQDPAALEVKSTQALDHLDLSGDHKWRFLQPCASVRACRMEALPQLGLMNGVAQNHCHRLRLRLGQVVPFPVGKGIAVAVAAVDGRVNTLREDQRCKTPPGCRATKRDCWTCLPNSGCHFVMTTMPNAPGRLSLAGAPSGEQGRAWMAAYQRWGEAVHARDRDAAAVMSQRLLVEVDKWIKAMNLGEDDVAPLRVFWKSHLSRAVHDRGIGAGMDRTTEATASDDAEPIGSESPQQDFDAMATISSALARSQGGATPSVRWFSTRPMQRQRASFTLTQNDRYSELRMMSAHWWGAEDCEHSEEPTRSSVAYLLTMATGRSFLSGDRSLLPLKRVAARVGTSQVPLGWCWDTSSEGRRKAWTLLSELGLRSHWSRPVWLARMVYGDPRVTLRVTDNGRAVLRIENSVFL